MSSTHYAYTKRWRANNPEKVQAQNKRYAQKYAGKPEMKNTRWQEKEICLLISNKYSASELSYLLGRSVRSINNKRYWLKRQHKGINND